MDYQKAQQLKNRSLLSLIAQKKFKEGQGLGSSITGAISDKFTARATRFKQLLVEHLVEVNKILVILVVIREIKIIEKIQKGLQSDQVQ